MKSQVKAKLSLSDLQGLLSSFHKNNIRYCHFKSNIHVGDGLIAHSDLDLLIERGSRGQALELLLSHGFKLFKSGPQTTYPGVEDWIGARPDSALYHLHVHWGVILGEEFLKGYAPPLAAGILENRVWNDKHGIFTASPEGELLLLAIRVSLRRPLQRSLSDLRPSSAKDRNWIREADWLLGSASANKFGKNFDDILSDELISRIYNELRASSSRQKLVSRKTKLLVRKEMSAWRTYSPIEAFFRRRQRFAFNVIWAKAQNMLGRPFVNRRQPQAGGLIIAIVGPDNSGKSTQSKAAVAWLSGKLDSHYLYLGSGDGPRSWYRFVWELVGKPMRLLLRSVDSESQSEKAPDKRDSKAKLSFNLRLRAIYKNIFAVLLAIEKARKVRFAVQARNRGSVVVTDRFPQLVRPQINDGPMLEAKPNSRWSAWELGLLEKVSRVQPDVVITLTVSASIVRGRAEEFNPDRFRQKSDAFGDENLWPRAIRLEVNANKSVSRVERDVQAAIWAHM